MTTVLWSWLSWTAGKSLLVTKLSVTFPVTERTW